MSGLVASDPTVSRTIDALAKDAPAALRAIHAARAVAWQRVWQLAGRHAPHAGIDAANPVVIDVDATLVTAHSDKEGAAPTFKRGMGIIRCRSSSTTAQPESVNRWRCRSPRSPPTPPPRAGT
jgi:hypothetical protein